MSIYIGPPAHSSGNGNVPPFAQTIHATAPGLGYPSASRPGRAVETAHYFQSPSSGGSAHVVCDIAESVRCASDDLVCWHAPPNRRTLGYEICAEANYTREQWLSPQVWPAVARVAAEVKADAAKYGIPIHRCTVAEVAANRGGQRGHVDVSQAFHQSDHTDPGPNFPWDRFMPLLQAGPAPAHPTAPADGTAPAFPLPAGHFFWLPRADPRVHSGFTADDRNRLWHWQTQMVRRGWKVNVDGRFTDTTLSVMRAFQGEKRITGESVLGPRTWAAAWTAALS